MAALGVVQLSCGLLVSSFISRFVEPVRLFPACMESHRRFVLQQLVHTARSASWPAGKSFLLRVTDLGNQNEFQCDSTHRMIYAGVLMCFSYPHC